MLPRILPLALLVALIGAVPTNALALGNGVWVDCKHGTNDFSLCESAFADARLVWDAEAAAEALANGTPAPTGSVVHITTELDYNSLTGGDYRLLVITQPGPCVAGVGCCHSYPSTGAGWPSPWCEQEHLTMLIPHFLSIGGKIILLADNDTGEEMAKNSALREILASIPDHDLNIGSDSIGTTCLQTNDIVSDPLTEGLSGWKYAQTNTVTGGDPLIRFPGNGATASLAAAARIPSGGEVIVFGDVEGFWTAAGFCLDSGLHAPLWRNLYRDQSAAVDDDGDGYPDGVDCNDQDPDINPDAEEDCLNGRDDDCDGDIDGQDSDCPETGDDDTGDDDTGDDDTGDTGDDDTGGGGFGDDDTNGDWGADTGCNCTAAVAGSGNSAWLALLLLGLVASVRRRLS